MLMLVAEPDARVLLVIRLLNTLSIKRGCLLVEVDAIVLPQAV